MNRTQMTRFEDPSPNQRVEAMTRSAVTLLFQSKSTGALLVMPHPYRSAKQSA
jgi:hypothetical protein